MIDEVSQSLAEAVTGETIDVDIEAGGKEDSDDPDECVLNEFDSDFSDEELSDEGRQQEEEGEEGAEQSPAPAPYDVFKNPEHNVVAVWVGASRHMKLGLVEERDDDHRTVDLALLELARQGTSAWRRPASARRLQNQSADTLFGGAHAPRLDMLGGEWARKREKHFDVPPLLLVAADELHVSLRPRTEVTGVVAPPGAPAPAAPAAVEPSAIHVPRVVSTWGSNMFGDVLEGVELPARRVRRTHNWKERMEDQSVARQAPPSTPAPGRGRGRGSGSGRSSGASAARGRGSGRGRARQVAHLRRGGRPA